MELFTQGQANKILDHIPYTTTREWAKAGLFQWHEGEEDGRGKHRLYSRLNLYQIALCDYLMRNANIRTNVVRDIMRQFFAKNSQDEKTLMDNKLVEPIMVIGVQGNSSQVGYYPPQQLSEMVLNPMSYNVLTNVINLKLLKEQVDNAIRTKLV